MSVAAQTLSPPSRTLMFLEGRAISELGAFLGALPLLSLAPRGDGHPVLVLPGLVASDTSTRPLRSFFERSASGETQVLEQYLVRMFVTAGEALASDAELRTEINQGLVAVLRTVVAEQKSGVSTFISDQVKSWDMGQLISLIEINIGRDLQYIRFNGSLIGGLAGLALYTLEYLLRLL